jgi:hypothetical protein
MPHRVEPSRPEDWKEIEKLLAEGEQVVLQFSKPEQYPAPTMERLEKLCQQHGSRVMVRFWHHAQGFSGQTLHAIPSVAALTLDCMDQIQPRDLKEIWKLLRLRALHVGFDKLADADTDFLHGPNLQELRELGVGPSRKENVDLGPIGGMKNLQKVFISKQQKNIGSLAGLPKLTELSLNVKNAVSLDFVPTLKKLRELSLILGGRENLDEAAHPGLEALEVCRVRGLSRLAPADFPNLKRLKIEEQAQLETLSFTAKNSSLARIKIDNCKTLSTVAGLKSLPKLEELILWNSPAMNFEKWLAAGLPKSLKRCDFGVSRPKLDKEYRERLNQLGYQMPLNHGMD